MKQIVAINASPRKEWNAGTLAREAARSAQVEIFDLYRLHFLIWL